MVPCCRHGVQSLLVRKSVPNMTSHDISGETTAWCPFVRQEICVMHITIWLVRTKALLTAAILDETSSVLPGWYNLEWIRLHSPSVYQDQFITFSNEDIDHLWRTVWHLGSAYHGKVSKKNIRLTLSAVLRFSLVCLAWSPAYLMLSIEGLGNINYQWTHEFRSWGKRMFLLSYPRPVSCSILTAWPRWSFSFRLIPISETHRTASITTLEADAGARSVPRHYRSPR